jgi:hypothetical protein
MASGRVPGSISRFPSVPFRASGLRSPSFSFSVVPEIKLCEIAVQVPLPNLMVNAVDATLQDGKVPLNRVHADALSAKDAKDGAPLVPWRRPRIDARFAHGTRRSGRSMNPARARKSARPVVIPVACELRSPATAFGRVELFSFFRFVTRPSKGRSSTVLPSSDVATSDAETVEEPGFNPA